jgi:pyruvate formate-lyase/glycerol dehydratase family glycyl radical enzyme
MPVKAPKPSVRAQKIKERLLANEIEIDSERAGYYTAVWKRTEDVAPCMRTALALEETLRNVTIGIEDEDQLAGIRTAKPVGIVVPVERFPEIVATPTVIVAGSVSRGESTDVSVGLPEELKNDILAYWSDKTTRKIKEDNWRQAGLYDQQRNALLPHDIGILAVDTQGHCIPGFNRVLEIGFNGIETMARQRLGALRENEEDYEHKKDFLRSVPVVCQAVRDFSERYAALAEQVATRADAERKVELLAIAERCRSVPANPPRTFMEAFQSIWMTHVALCISYGLADVFSIGRIDQYLYPFFQADLAAGRISREKAQEVVEEFHLKTATSVLPAQYTTTLGGLTSTGEDGTNELSFMFLQAVKDLGGLRNNVSVRISPKTPREFLLKAWDVHRFTAGLAFFNDEVIIRDMLADAYSLEDARDYSIVGCVEPTTTGKDFSYTAGNFLSIVRALEMALNEGRLFYNEAATVGAHTPPAGTFTSFEDLKQAYAEQVRFCVDMGRRAIELKDKAYSDFYPSPLLSSTIIGCLESGKDVTRGGAVYNNGHLETQGLATVVNSLTAIRWAVFEEGLLSMEELVQHLRTDFEGAEPLRQQLMRKAPKYGNDDPKADELAEWVVQLFSDEVRKQKCGRGGMYRPLILSTGFQVIEGFGCSAAADGRRARTTVSDGISPAHGTELNGLTAVFHSAARAGRGLVSDGTTLTITLSPGLLSSDEGLEKMASMIEAYFKMQGRHVQFTPVDANTLRDAREHPDAYPDLTVKVSGYSAVFVELPEPLQNDIIGRTEFCEV